MTIKVVVSQKKVEPSAIWFPTLRVDKNKNIWYFVSMELCILMQGYGESNMRKDVGYNPTINPSKTGQPPRLLEDTEPFIGSVTLSNEA